MPVLRTWGWFCLAFRLLWLTPWVTDILSFRGSLLSLLRIRGTFFIISAPMRKSSQLIFIMIAPALISFSVCVRVSAQRNPTMASQTTDELKDRLFAQFTDYKKSLNPEERRLAYPAARDYLRKFGGDDDSNARDVQKFITEYERAAHDGDVFASYTAKNYAKAFEVGRTRLKSDADDFFVLATLTEAGYENAVAGDLTLNDETIGYTRRAIKLLEGGKLSKADPFKNMDIARGFLNSTLGWFVKEQLPVEAAAAFLKAAQSDSPYRTDPAVYHRMGVAILRGEFAQLSTEYNEKYGLSRPLPNRNKCSTGSAVWSSERLTRMPARSR
jgi:hypothetical protein